MKIKALRLLTSTFVPDSETTEDESEEPVETKEDDIRDQVVYPGTQHLLEEPHSVLYSQLDRHVRCVLIVALACCSDGQTYRRRQQEKWTRGSYKHKQARKKKQTF